MPVLELVDPEYLRSLFESIRNGVALDKTTEHTIPRGRKVVVPELVAVALPGAMWAEGDVDVLGELLVV
ncbi:MAG: hypothetical protein QXK11_07345 [Pyrobaculum sp.]|uniref:hypothetical protein n=1 Tax=Pyrobaculum sp. TaxID=2004705 RepID=UPI00317B4D32